MLSDRERRVWDELERSYDVEAASPPPGEDRGGRPARSRDRARVSLAVGIAGGVCLLLLIAGAPAGALALALATALGWGLWRYRTALETASRDTGARPGRTGEPS